MSLLNKKMTIVTHNGSFHADEVFACATLSLWAEKNNVQIEIKRTRDEEAIKKADIVVDVGMLYDEKTNRFDHHQKGGAGEHKNGLPAQAGIPYASFGLVWKKYGREICGNLETALIVDKKLVTPVDAMDNGVNISFPNESGIMEHTTSNMICDFNPTWREGSNLLYKQFEKAVYIAKDILMREITWSEAFLFGKLETERLIQIQNNPEILIIDKIIEWHEAVAQNKNIKLVVYPGEQNDGWSIQVGKDNLADYNSNRIVFPFGWRGLKNEDLARESGIRDAIFCHTGGWFAVAKSKEGAIELAKRALENKI